MGLRAVRLALAAVLGASLLACTSVPLPPMAPLNPVPVTPAQPPAPPPVRDVLPPPAPAPAPAPVTMFIWPANGPILTGFDGSENKGIDIGGRAGEPVRAAADGQVIYAGSGLAGYGNMIIIKHDATYITAYGHNQRLLVAENERVRQGQQIAEMGSSDADRVKLRFEIRKNGEPVDPLLYLQGSRR